MGGRRGGRVEGPGAADRGWPRWARVAASIAVGLHLLAIVAAAADWWPWTRDLAEGFRPYLNAVALGQTYRYYERLDVTEDRQLNPDEEFRPWFTPVATARLTFADGREEERRLPDPALRPRLRYQRQLALAHSLYEDFRRHYDPLRRVQLPSPYGRSYARHICRESGCARVELFVQEHRVPELKALRRALADPSGPPVDLEADEFYTVRELIGDYPCDEFRAP